MLFILDRDGVVNQESQHYIKSPEEWIPIPGSLEAIAKLKKEGHVVVIATNQSGIARELFNEEILASIHKKMQLALQSLGVDLDGIYVCPHHPNDHCLCRKPLPGLLLQIQTELGVDLRQAICIGDSLRDIEAAQAAGANPILVLTGNGQKTAKQLISPIPTFLNLQEAVTYLLQELRIVGNFSESKMWKNVQF